MFPSCRCASRALDCRNDVSTDLTCGRICVKWIGPGPAPRQDPAVTASSSISKSNSSRQIAAGVTIETGHARNP